MNAGLRFLGIIAFILLSVDCAMKAIGADEQVLFAADRIWLWWPAAVGWACSAIAFVLTE